jgi:hypothetical protein
MPSALPSRAFTLSEAAAALRKSKRWLLEWLRARPVDKYGDPFFTPVGRDKIFHQNDIDRVELTLREEAKCHSNSGRQGRARRPTSRSGARTSDAAWKLAAELTNDPSLSNNSSASKSASKSTVNIQRPNLSLIQGSRHS